MDLDYRDYLVIYDELYRPSEVNILQGDAAKAHQKLYWFPTVSLKETGSRNGR